MCNCKHEKTAVAENPIMAAPGMIRLPLFSEDDACDLTNNKHPQ